MEWAWLPLFCGTGALAGLAAGIFGVGGGFIIVPVLIFVYGTAGVAPEVLTHTALGTSLAAIFPGLLNSARAHYRRGSLELGVARKVAAGLLPGVLLGSFLASHMPGVALRVAVALLLWSVASKMLLNWNPKPDRVVPGFPGLAATGGFIGTISALAGVGGGGLMVPFFAWCNMRMQSAVGTSAAGATVVSLGGTLGYLLAGWGHPLSLPWASGYVHWPAVLCIVLFSVFTAPAGAALAHRWSNDVLRRLFALFLLVSGGLVLFGPHGLT